MDHYGHDMDHDGKITSKDTALFHEMMEEDEQTYNSTCSSSGTPSTSVGGALKQSIPLFICLFLIALFLFID